jgi:hypothetical protein
MVARNKRFSSIAHSGSSVDNQQTIEAHTAEFLARGGTVQQIPMGVTAYAKLYGAPSAQATAAGTESASS